jgi:hypothetical protein
VAGATLWCPSCGAEYVASATRCADCRVALSPEPPRATRPVEDGDDLVELGTWSRLEAQILRRRLETAGITTMVEWSSPGPGAEGTIVVPEPMAEFAGAIISELEVTDEVPDTSPLAYLARIEEHLEAAGALLEELRTRIEQDEAEARDR